MKQASILIVVTMFGFSACGNPAPQPNCEEMGENQDTLVWVYGTVKWENSDQERIVLNISLPEENLLLSEEPAIDGGEIIDSARDIYNDMRFLIVPEDGAEVVVTLSFDCNGAGYQTAVRVDLSDPDNLTVEALAPEDLIDVDASVPDAGE